MYAKEGFINKVERECYSERFTPQAIDGLFVAAAERGKTMLCL